MQPILYGPYHPAFCYLLEREMAKSRCHILLNIPESTQLFLGYYVTEIYFKYFLSQVKCFLGVNYLGHYLLFHCSE